MNATCDGLDDQPAVAVRALAPAEADRLEAADAAAWDAAAARGDAAAAVVTIAGATGPRAHLVNGTFDRVPSERAPGGAPVYKRRGQAWSGGGGDVWLVLARGTWFVGSTKSKDARKGFGWAATVDAVAPGTLPHEVPAGGWRVWDSAAKKWNVQPSVCVSGTPQ